MNPAKVETELAWSSPEGRPERTKDFPAGTWILHSDGRLLLASGWSECFIDVASGKVEQMKEFVDFDYAVVESVKIVAKLRGQP